MGIESGRAIELGDVSKFLCPCCQRESETVHGFLYDERGDTSVYFAGYTHGHPERRANFILSIGGWGEGTSPDDRRAIAMQILATGQGHMFTFPPAESSPWYGEEFLGRLMQPQELSDEDRSLSRELAKTAMKKDPRVADYFERG